MRWVGLGTVAVTLLAPPPVRAQAVTPSDLVGTWKGIIGVDPTTETDETGHLILHAVVFRPDSTYTETWAGANGQGQRCQNGRLASLAGDTVTWAGGSGSVKVVLRNQQLAFYNWGNLSDPTEAYQRLDSTKTPSLAHTRLAAC